MDLYPKSTLTFEDWKKREILEVVLTSCANPRERVDDVLVLISTCYGSEKYIAPVVTTSLRFCYKLSSNIEIWHPSHKMLENPPPPRIMVLKYSL